MGRTAGLWSAWAASLVVVLIAPMPARAFELSGGVGLGGLAADDETVGGRYGSMPCRRSIR